MKIELVGEVIEHPDGTGIVELDIDEEGKEYLMQLGFEELIKRGIKAMEKEYKIKRETK